MNVNESHYNLNILNTNNNVVSGLKAEGQAMSVNTQAMTANSQISQVSVGQMFNGQIIDITNSQVSIMLEGNKTLYANMAENVNLNIGDSITFMVKENNGSNVVIKPFFNQESTMKDSAIFKILELNNFSPTDKNYQIAETLMNHNMPVDKNSMQRIMQQSYKFSDASIDTLVTLNKIGIPVNESTIKQYEDYITNNHKLIQNISDVGEILGDFSAEQIQMLDTPKDILAFSGEIMTILSDESDMPNINLSETIQISGDTNSLTFMSETTQLTDMEFYIEVSDIITDRFSFDNEMATQLVDKLVDTGFDKASIKAIVDRSETPLQLLNNINHILNNNDMLMSGIATFSIKELFVSDAYKHILGEAVKDKFSIAGEKMESPEEIDELYSKIYDKSNRLLNSFSGSGSELKQELQNSAKGMQERLDFMQNLNQMYSYAQIPVRLSGNDMNSELFVYMNKRNLKEAKEAVSALLHLDMDHLGATDVHVSLHGTNVHTRFYVEDEISAKIIDQHMTMLEKAINENGFVLTNEVITREPSINAKSNMVVEEMLGNDMEQSVKRYSFDVRM